MSPDRPVSGAVTGQIEVEVVPPGCDRCGWWCCRQQVQGGRPGHRMTGSAAHMNCTKRVQDVPTIWDSVKGEAPATHASRTRSFSRDRSLQGREVQPFTLTTAMADLPADTFRSIHLAVLPSTQGRLEAATSARTLTLPAGRVAVTLAVPAVTLAFPTLLQVPLMRAFRTTGTPA